eukprot:gnl/Dysnectes_brevis/1088_a1218_2742.p1 GENE.gnl/Dysnectes_brevis/1088_a1218_2742~~gnl/Dysnectes_brevis/1088_a1218_2742.p1  ORF type:complete len:876 (-),score=317.12 gnl/Dysnectes_brevis/1088_a1218_2742:60-2687(-)
MKSTKKEHIPIKGVGVVKQVLSGDSLVIINKSHKEITLCLAYIDAPRYVYKDVKASESFSYQSREFLRKKIVGRKVRFETTHEVNPERHFALVYISSTCVNEAVVRYGWARVRVQSHTNELYEKLLESQAHAVTKKLGFNTSKPSLGKVPRIVEPTGEERLTLFHRLKGEEAEGHVEYVRDAANLFIVLHPSMIRIPFALAGVRCPGFKLVDEGSRVPEPLAIAARSYVEERILQRDVTLVVGGISGGGGSFVGHLKTKKGGDIALSLVQAGYAQIVDWSLGLASNPDGIRSSEQAAQKAKKGIWKRIAAKPVSVGRGSCFTAQVLQVVSGDQLIVRPPPRLPGDIAPDTRIFLSSIRAPRLNFRVSPLEPWSLESREHLRKLVAGKSVEVSVEYTRTDSDVERMFATVIVGGTNVADSIVRSGFATVSHHSAEDDDRSRFYHQLVSAELVAQKKRLGLHAPTSGKKAAPIHRIKDLVYGKSGAVKELYAMLPAGRRVKVSVEHCFSGHRVKVLLGHSTMVCFALAGIRAPSVKNKEPLSTESLEFARDSLLGRDVELQVSGIADKSGTLLGTLWMKEGGKEHNYGVTLLDRGLAELIDMQSSRIPHHGSLSAAVKRAQGARVGIHSFMASSSIKPAIDAGTPAKPTHLRAVGLSAAHNPSKPTEYYFRLVSQKPPALSEKALRDAGASYSKDTGLFVKQMVAYRHGDRLRRGRVISIRDGEVRMQLVDLGERVSAPLEKVLAPLPIELCEMPPTAVAARLALLVCPDEERLSSSREGFIKDFKQAVDGEHCSVIAMGWAKDGVLETVLSDPFDPTRAWPETRDSLNAYLIDNGLAHLTEDAPQGMEELYAQLNEAQRDARYDYVGMWEHGGPRE